MKRYIVAALLCSALLLVGCTQAQAGIIKTAVDRLPPLPTLTPTPEPTVAVVPTEKPKAVKKTPKLPRTTPYPDSMLAPLPELIPYGTIKPSPTPTPVPSYEPNPEGINGQNIADLAEGFVGYNYLYGGKDPETGFDCSGLVYYCYGYYGVALNRTAAAQAQNGAHVELDDLRPGDVLCFYTGGSYIGHCGIYIGDGKYVHAEGSATGVVLSYLNERLCKIEARRMVDW